MDPFEITLWIFFAIDIALAIAASRRVFLEHENVARTVGQMAFVWLLPFIGPLVTIYILSNESEPGSGKYASDEPPLGDA